MLLNKVSGIVVIEQLVKQPLKLVTSVLLLNKVVGIVVMFWQTLKQPLKLVALIQYWNRLLGIVVILVPAKQLLKSVALIQYWNRLFGIVVIGQLIKDWLKSVTPDNPTVSPLNIDTKFVQPLKLNCLKPVFPIEIIFLTYGAKVTDALT